MPPAKKAKLSKPMSRIGLVGCGTVGGSVLKILSQKKAFLSTMGITVDVVKICVRDVPKAKANPYLPEGCEVTADVADILSDPSIECVVEVAGGTTFAKDVVFGAIAAGKHVVTANKALLAEFLPELLELLQKHPEAQLGYEAAVCGGIPIIHALQKDFLGDEVQSLTGIMNGTTNFILSKMEQEGAAYDDVLKEAQALGFAEADPTADVGGFDVQAKIALLTRLGMGMHVERKDIHTSGIQAVQACDFQYAALLKSTVKLLGVSRLCASGELTIAVAPHLVPTEHPIGSIDGATNIVEVGSKNLSNSFLVGQGAGGDPTANSVVSDILGLCQGPISIPFPKTVPTKLATDFIAPFYVRFIIKDVDQLGIIHDISKACLEHKVSIDQILQIPRESITQNPLSPGNQRIPFVLMTDNASRKNVEAMCAQMDKASFIVGMPFFMPVLNCNK